MFGIVMSILAGLFAIHKFSRCMVGCGLFANVCVAASFFCPRNHDHEVLCPCLNSVSSTSVSFLFFLLHLFSTCSVLVQYLFSRTLNKYCRSSEYILNKYRKNLSFASDKRKLV